MEDREPTNQGAREKAKKVREVAVNAELCNGHREENVGSISRESFEYESGLDSILENSFNGTSSDVAVVGENHVTVTQHGSCCCFNNANCSHDRTWCRKSAARSQLKCKQENAGGPLNGRKLNGGIPSQNCVGIQQPGDLYTNVCDLYRHENDVIFGRTRGGDRVLSNDSQMIVVSHDEEPVLHESNHTEIAYHQQPNNELLNGNNCSRRETTENDGSRLGSTTPEHSKVVKKPGFAPLAIPESFSDDESTRPARCHRMRQYASNGPYLNGEVNQGSRILTNDTSNTRTDNGISNADNNLSDVGNDTLNTDNDTTRDPVTDFTNGLHTTANSHEVLDEQKDNNPVTKANVLSVVSPPEVSSEIGNQPFDDNRVNPSIVESESAVVDAAATETENIRCNEQLQVETEKSPDVGNAPDTATETESEVETEEAPDADHADDGVDQVNEVEVNVNDEEVNNVEVNEYTSDVSDNDADEIEADMVVSDEQAENNEADEEVVEGQGGVNAAENVVHGNNGPLRYEQDADNDSGNNDDIGDFIEADLPPNVGRLAFFSRDSTSDEDEGCGDDLLPNNDEDVVSDNETIDPIDRGYLLPGRPNEPKVSNDDDSDDSDHEHQAGCRAYNILSHNVETVRGEMSNLYPCNISCDKSTEENYIDDDDDDDIYAGMRSSPECSACVSDCAGGSPIGDRNSASSSLGDRNSCGDRVLKGDNTCACCDRPMEVDCERQKEMGVNVCDQCFREHNSEQNRWSENLYGARRKFRPGSGGSNINSYQRNMSHSLNTVNNNYDKVSNNSPLYGRFSSTDSDPFDRIYVSDSSELVSPELESGVEPSVFQPSSHRNPEGAAAAVGPSQCKTDGSKHESQRFYRQSASCEFTSPEEVLYCPYFTRRSRSMDQYLRRGDEEPDNRSNDCDTPNIAVKSSNFQDDESNKQEKVFVKEPYVSSSFTSSSDEEENIRVPGAHGTSSGGIPGSSSLPATSGSVVSSSHSQASPTTGTAASNGALAGDNSRQHGTGGGSAMGIAHPAHNQQFGASNNMDMPSSSDNNAAMYKASMMAKHGAAQKLRLDENEPIYEDIDQLGLFLEDTANLDGDTDSDRLAAQPLCNAISKLRQKRPSRGPISDIEKVMIWKEYEAYLVQVKQIGTSACGPTAVLNVLKAFDFQVDKEEVAGVIKSNLRMEAAPIPYYLFSRYSAGTTADDLVEGVSKVTRGAIRGRFFHFFPHRDVQLLKWLGYWMKKGAVPVATLNLQKGVKPGWTIPDAWHHQMVYGVSSKGVYLTNPLEIVAESVILEQLSSDSVLLVRRQDVVGRFRDWCPLNEIIKQTDTRWRTMNVLGQVVHMLREQCCMPIDQLVSMKAQLTSHVQIPASYRAGIILFMRANSENLDELMSSPELPIKQPKPDT